jgi:hypothetical protein
MAAVVQLKKPSSPNRITCGAPEPHSFPESSTPPALPVAICDEIWSFTRSSLVRAVLQTGLTFEQFLLVVAAIIPANMPATRDETRTL